MQTPRIYIADIADYVAGELRGIWIDLSETMEADDISQAINEMLAEKPGHEEWALHDSEHMPNIGEHPSLETIESIALAINDHSADIVAAYCDNVGTDYLNEIDECYCGHFDDGIEGYAYELIQDSGDLKKMGSLAQYFDYSAYARDMKLNGEVWESNGHVFRSL